MSDREHSPEAWAAAFRRVYGRQYSFQSPDDVSDMARLQLAIGELGAARVSPPSGTPPDAMEKLERLAKHWYGCADVVGKYGLAGQTFVACADGLHALLSTLDVGARASRSESPPQEPAWRLTHPMITSEDGGMYEGSRWDIVPCVGATVKGLAFTFPFDCEEAARATLDFMNAHGIGIVQRPPTLESLAARSEQREGEPR